MLLCLLSLGVTQGAERKVFQEDFNYFYGEQIAAAWETVATQGGKPVNVGTDAGVESAPYAKLGNAIVSNTIPVSIRSDWKLSFKMLHTNAARDAWLGLFDPEGKNGYVAVWRSGPPGTEGKNKGVVAIEKFKNVDWSAKNAWRTHGERLTEYTNSGHISTQLPMAQFELTWSQKTGTLTLSVDGQVVTTAQDSDITEFSKILIRGNGTVLFDSLQLSVE